MAASYCAVRRKPPGQAEARARRAAAGPQLVQQPRVLAGSVTTATLPWFLAAARIIVGPPTSICSIASSGSDAGPRHRRLERVEGDDDQVDRRDAVARQRLQVRGHVAAGQDAAVDLRVQRLHPAVEHLGEAGDLGHVADGDPGSRSSLAVPPVDRISTPRRGQPTGEVDHAGLVVDRDQRATDLHALVASGITMTRLP